MPNQLYAGFDSDDSLRRYDLDAGTWSTRIADIAPATFGCFKGAWDGTYYYFSGDSGDLKLYRFDPADDSIDTLAGGAAMTVGSSAADLVYTNRGGSGSRIFWVSGAAFGYYDVIADTFTSIGSLNGTDVFVNRMAWDGGQYLYIVGYPSVLGTRQVTRYDLDADTSAVLATLPPSLVTTNACGAVVEDGKLWFLKITGAGNGVYNAPLPDCGAWTTVFSGSLSNGGQVANSTDQIGTDTDLIATTRFAAYRISTNGMNPLATAGTPVATPLALAGTRDIPAQPTEALLAATVPLVFGADATLTTFPPAGGVLLAATLPLVFGADAGMLDPAEPDCCVFTYSSGASGCGFAFSGGSSGCDLSYADGRQEGCEDAA